MKPSSADIHEATTMSANAPIVISKNRKAASSLRKGLSTPTSLEEVDRRVHDDPHHVDKMPVDAGALDAVMVLRRVVTPNAPDDDHEQQAEADGDVRTVQPGEPEEDRSERSGAGVEADVQVLDHLRAQEGEAHQERQHHPCEEPLALAALDRLEGPVHREA